MRENYTTHVYMVRFYIIPTIMRLEWLIAIIIGVVMGQNEFDSSSIKFPSFEEWKEKNKSGTWNLTVDENNTIINSYENLPKRGRKIRSSEVIEELDEMDDVDVYEVGKTYKDRFNFASFDCAATVIKTNSEAKSANAVLLDSMDTYLLNECGASNQFVIIELCEDILVDEVVMANFEFYSSMFHKIRFSVSDRYPVQQWVLLGEFEAVNERRIQRFPIVNPLIWAKFIKIEILTHYGDEFYCPISTIQVHGKTMIEQFKEEVPAPVISTPSSVPLPEFDVHLGKAFASCFEYNGTLVEQQECSAGYSKLEEFLQQESSEICDIDEVEVNESIKPPQESIYRNIVKRLNALEGNNTLTQRYVEEQSKLISEALTKFEMDRTARLEVIVREISKLEISIEWYKQVTYIMMGINIILITYLIVTKDVEIDMKKEDNLKSIKIKDINVVVD